MSNSTYQCAVLPAKRSREWKIFLGKAKGGRGTTHNRAIKHATPGAHPVGISITTSHANRDGICRRRSLGEPLLPFLQIGHSSGVADHPFPHPGRGAIFVEWGHLVIPSCFSAARRARGSRLSTTPKSTAQRILAFGSSAAESSSRRVFMAACAAPFPVRRNPVKWGPSPPPPLFPPTTARSKSAKARRRGSSPHRHSIWPHIGRSRSRS